MGKPSIFNSDYHKIMRKRKIIFRTVIVVIALGAIFLAYNKSAFTDLKKILADLGGSLNNSNQIQNQKQQEDSPGAGGANHNQDTSSSQGQGKNAAGNTLPQVTAGEFTFTYPNKEVLSITYEKKDNDVKLTGISSDDKGISFSVRDDGKSIVFDNPKINGIWIYNADGTSKRLDPDVYRQVGGEELVFSREYVLRQFNNYIWAARPQFLKDGRIVYQSYIPWFKKKNNIYLWVTDSSGSSNKWLLNTGQTGLLSYGGFTQDNRLIVQLGSIKYALNVEDGSLVKIN